MWWDVIRCGNFLMGLGTKFKVVGGNDFLSSIGIKVLQDLQNFDKT